MLTFSHGLVSHVSSAEAAEGAGRQAGGEACEIGLNGR